MKKNLIHFFAVIGFGTFILLACSVDDIADSMNDNNNSQITSSNYGKYQISAMTGGSNNTSEFIIALNTETGEIRSYTLTTNGWTQAAWGDLTLTH